MRTMTLPWYPPAPAAGPASILQLPPDDWALEPKIDGVRVIWLDGHPFTRHGGLLTTGNGAERLIHILAKIPHTLDGEWVQAWETFFAFDLPECPVDYDGRRSALTEILSVAIDDTTNAVVAAFSVATASAHVRLVISCIANFPEVYADLKGRGAEGVVLKRPRALYGNQLRASNAAIGSSGGLSGTTIRSVAEGLLA